MEVAVFSDLWLKETKHALTHTHTLVSQRANGKRNTGSKNGSPSGVKESLVRAISEGLTQTASFRSSPKETTCPCRTIAACI